MKIKKLGALLVSAALCVGMAAPAFAFEGEAAPVEQPVLPEVVEEDVVTITDETSGALTPEGNLTLVDDYHTDYSDGSGQQFITLVSKSGNTFYLVIDRNSKGAQTVHFMNLVDEADLLALMEEDAADAYTAEKEAAAQAEQDKLKAEEEAKKAAEEAAASGEEQPKGNKVTKIASGFLGVVVLIALAAGGIFYAFAKQKQKKQAEKEALDPDANYTEDKGDFEIPVEDEPEETGEEQPKENKVTKIASGFLGVVVLIALAAGGGFYAFAKQKQKKQAEKEALDPDANYTEDKGDFEIPTEDEPEEAGEEDTEPI